MDERVAREAVADSPQVDSRPQPCGVDAAGSHWRHLLVGSPREVLARIVPNDPLGLRAVVAQGLRDSAMFLDSDRVHLRALALVARAAPRYHGRPDFPLWVRGHAGRAIEEILREESESASADPDPAFQQLARPLGLDPAAMRRACLVFNRLPEPERAAFQALVVEGRGLDELARTAGQSATELARRARRALDALLQAAQLEPSGVPRGPTGRAPLGNKETNA